MTEPLGADAGRLAVDGVVPMSKSRYKVALSVDGQRVIVVSRQRVVALVGSG